MDEDGRLWQIYDWQNRQMECLNYADPGPSKPIHLSKVEEIADKIAEEIEYDSDCGLEDYWQTSCETLVSGIGDCDDKAILIFAILREDFGLPDELNRIGYLRHKSEWIAHFVNILRFSRQTYIVDNREQCTRKLYEYEEFFELFSYYELALEFNLINIWDYR